MPPTIQDLHDVHACHGSVPLRLRLPGRRVVVLLDSADGGRVLDRSPELFALASE
jgi:hypothetical protein